MNKTIIFIIAFSFSALTIVLFGCPALDQNTEWGWNAERPQRIQDTFSHDVHKTAFEKEGFECLTCHTMDTGMENPETMEQMIKLSDKSFFPGKETCHFCHYNPEAGNIAPDRCGICHFNTREIQPPNHNFDWMAKHEVYAKSDMNKCEDCHNQTFCQDCHNRRDLPTRRFHDNNYQFVHGIDARVNPGSCGNCHEVSFCNKCHTEGGYDR